MAALQQLIAAGVSGSGAGAVERVVFGTSDPTAIAAVLDELCREHLGSPITGAISYAASVGCTAAARLADGRDVVVKTFQPRWSHPFLSAVQRVQGSLARSGFPCARPIAGPVPAGQNLALIEGYLADPGQLSIEPSMLDASARGLARQVASCRGLDGRELHPHPLDGNDGAIFPEPHSPVFDFQRSASDAAWIDAVAAEATQMRDQQGAAPVIAHTDWAARNVRMTAADIVAVYDWDSLAVVSETTAVGQAAATWSAHDAGPDAAPSAEEIATYVERYEVARGDPFTAAERGAAGAAALYVLAYTARCEHALDPEEATHHRARPRLRSDGDRLLDLAKIMRGDR